MDRSGLSELVRDFRLEARFLNNGETVHEFAGRQQSSRVERWKRIKVLGEGGFGRVWLQQCVSCNTKPSQLRATKEISLQGAHIVDHTRELEALVKFSLQKYEARFVKCFGWYESPYSIYIAMEYLELGDLEAHVRKKHPPVLPERDVQSIICQVAEGLSLMHENGFAHRDLKPQNILLKSHPPNEWWVKIADFGISKRACDQSQVTMGIGTLGYMAPEMHQLFESHNLFALDIWALGEISYRMLTGQPSFNRLAQLIDFSRQKLPFPREKLADAGVHELGVDFVISAMQADPKGRMVAKQALDHRWIRCLLPAETELKGTNWSDREALPTVAHTEASGSWSQLMEDESQANLPIVYDSSAGLNIANLNITQSEITLETRKDNPASTLSMNGPETINHHEVTNESSPILAVNFAPDGRLLAAMSERAVRFWHPTTREPVQIPIEKIESFLDKLNSASQSSLLDNRAISDKVVNLPAFAIDVLGASRMGHWFTEERNKELAISSEGILIACTAQDKSIVQIRETRKTCTDQMLRVRKNSAGSVLALDISHDGRFLAVVSSDRRVTVWSIEDRHLYTTLGKQSLLARKVIFSPDGKLLASLHENRLRIWDSETGDLRHILTDYYFPITEAKFTADGKNIVSAYNGTIRVWNLTTETRTTTLRGDKGKRAVISVATSCDGDLIASSSHNAITIWDALTGNTRHTIDCRHFKMSAMAFSPKSKKLALASSEGAFRMWDLATNTVRIHSSAPWSFLGWEKRVNMSSGTRWVARIVGTKVQLHDYATGTRRITLDHAHPVTAALVSPDNSLVASAMETGDVRVWSIETGDLIQRLSGPSTAISALDFSSNRKLLAFAFAGIVQLWDTRKWKLRTELKEPELLKDRIGAMAMSPDGKLLATAKQYVAGRSIKVWHIERKSVKYEFHDQTGKVFGLSFSPDSKYLAAICDFDTLMLWDLQKEVLLKTCTNGSFWAKGVVFSPDGELVASSSPDGELYVWNCGT